MRAVRGPQSPVERLETRGRPIENKSLTDCNVRRCSGELEQHEESARDLDPTGALPAVAGGDLWLLRSVTASLDLTVCRNRATQLPHRAESADLQIATRDRESIATEEHAMRKRPTLVALSAIATLCVASPPRAHDAPKLVPGFLYIATNSPTGNFVIRFSRSQSGALTKRNKTSTGGSAGTGNGAGALDPLGYQNSLILAGPSGPLLVVNAGSDTVASLDIDGERPFLIGAIPSGGTFPSSIATDGNLVYVLNARGTPNITGFRLDSRGALSPIPSSTRELPGGSASAPHDVRFTPDGTRLIVTEGGTNQIDVFEVGADGRITSGVTQPSSGSGPFGFAFGRGETLLVTAANSAALASYDAGSDDSLQVTTPALSNGQMAAC